MEMRKQIFRVKLENSCMNIIKEKKPDKISFIRNKDGTYKIIYEGVASISDDNIIYTNSRVEVPRCKVKWDNKGFLPIALPDEILVDMDSETYINIIEEET